MSRYRHVLAAVDFSEAAERVARRALEIARRNEAELTYLHVVEYVPPLDLGYEPVVAPDWLPDEEELLAAARARLEELAGRLEAREAHLRVEWGHPKGDVVRLAEEVGADLVVVGSHGRRGITRLLGSTADAVLHHARCDVLAVRIG